MLEIEVTHLPHCNCCNLLANEMFVLIYTYLSAAVPAIKVFFM